MWTELSVRCPARAHHLPVPLQLALNGGMGDHSLPGKIDLQRLLSASLHCFHIMVETISELFL